MKGLKRQRVSTPASDRIALLDKHLIVKQQTPTSSSLVESQKGHSKFLSTIDNIINASSYDNFSHIHYNQKSLYQTLFSNFTNVITSTSPTSSLILLCVGDRNSGKNLTVNGLLSGLLNFMLDSYSTVELFAIAKVDPDTVVDTSGNRISFQSLKSFDFENWSRFENLADAKAFFTHIAAKGHQEEDMVYYLKSNKSVIAVGDFANGESSNIMTSPFVRATVDPFECLSGGSVKLLWHVDASLPTKRNKQSQRKSRQSMKRVSRLPPKRPQQLEEYYLTLLSQKDHEIERLKSEMSIEDQAFNKYQALLDSKAYEFDQRLGMANSRVASLQDANQNLMNTLTETEAQLDTTIRQKDSLSKQLATKTAEFEILNKARQDMTSTLSKTVQELESARSELSQTKNESKMLQAQLETASQKSTWHLSDLRTLNAQCAELEDANDEMGREFLTVRTRNTTLQSQVQELEEQVSNLEVDVCTMKMVNDELNDVNLRLRNECAKVHVENGQLEDCVKNLQSKIEESEVEIIEIRKLKRNGQFEFVSESVSSSSTATRSNSTRRQASSNKSFPAHHQENVPPSVVKSDDHHVASSSSSSSRKASVKRVSGSSAVRKPTSPSTSTRPAKRSTRTSGGGTKGISEKKKEEVGEDLLNFDTRGGEYCMECPMNIQQRKRTKTNMRSHYRAVHPGARFPWVYGGRKH